MWTGAQCISYHPQKAWAPSLRGKDELLKILPLPSTLLLVRPKKRLACLDG